MKLHLAAAALGLLTAVSIAAEEKAEKLPHYDKQPSVNAAVKQLTEAQSAMATNPKDAADHLQKAADSLEHAIKDKGSFRATAIRLTKQALKHLEKGDANTAAHEINEALEAANKSGFYGGR